MSDIQAIQKDLSCPVCGGQRLWDPDLRALTCQSCGTPEKLFTSAEAKALAEAETAYDPGAPCTEKPEVAETRAHQCEACGGEVVFTGAALSDHCPYCDGPVVLGPLDQGYRTTALIPCRITAEQADENAKKWVAERRAAPNDLGAQVAKARVAGLYAPFWTFDSEEAVEYWAKIRRKSGKNTYYESIAGKMRIKFDDLLVPASTHVTPLIRDGILHEFSPLALEPYEAGYIAGFAAERHHQSVDEGLRANADDKNLLIRNRIKRHINKSGVTNLGYRTDTTGIHYRRILLPVWILHYTYKDEPMKVVVSGIDGRTFGERPFSTGKLAVYSALITAAAVAFGVVWGAMGIF